VNRLRAAIQDKADIAIDLRNSRKNGPPFWNALCTSPISNDAGEREVPRRTQELERTPAEARRVIEAKTVLLHEVDQRVKNNRCSPLRVPARPASPSRRLTRRDRGLGSAGRSGLGWREAAARIELARAYLRSARLSRNMFSST